MVKISEVIDQEVPFLYDDHLGHVTVCPSDLGTSLKITCVVDLPVLGKNPDALIDAITELKLETIPVPSPDDPKLVLFEVSNQIKLGFTEIEVIEFFIKALKGLIKTEIDFKKQELEKQKRMEEEEKARVAAENEANM